MVIIKRRFKLCYKLVKIIKWTADQRNQSKPIKTVYLNSQTPVSRFVNWAKSLSFYPKLKSSYIRLVQDATKDEKTSTVPKGHLAVYVGEKEDETKRFFVPVIYFNHPLFGDLLRWAEDEYGYGQSGGIQIPCRVSEFERVKKMITAAGGGIRRRRQLLRLRFSS